MTENSETICAFTILLEHKTTYAHFHMFFFPHEENISSKPGFKQLPSLTDFSPQLMARMHFYKH